MRRKDVCCSHLFVCIVLISIHTGHVFIKHLLRRPICSIPNEGLLGTQAAMAGEKETIEEFARREENGGQ